MVIEIQSDLFNDENNLSDINYLLTIFSECRRFDYFCEYTEIFESPVFQKLIPDLQKLIEENYNKIVGESIGINYSIGLSESEDVLNVNEAKRFFAQPFLLILENNLYDGYFVDALLENFKKKSKVIKRHKENNWFVYHNAGGVDNIPNIIQRLKKSFDGLPKDSRCYLRCFVLIDSDKEFNTNQSKSNRKSIFEFLNRNGISYHELEKREIENYLPDEVIESLPEIDEYLQTYIQLSPVQKDYFDLEKGFDKQPLSSFPVEVRNLYDDIDGKKEVILRKGMTIDRFKKFKSEFPKLFAHEKVTQETLKARTVHQVNDPNELQTVLDKITVEL